MAVQDHLHLSTSLGGDPEKSPTHQFRAIQRLPFWQGDVDVVRGATGKLFFGAVRDSSGNPIIHPEFDYHLLVTESEITTLAGMLHKPVYFVDHVHCDDGQDHTSYIKDMVLATLKYVRRFDPMLNLQIVGISLTDDEI